MECNEGKGDVRDEACEVSRRQITHITVQLNGDFGFHYKKMHLVVIKEFQTGKGMIRFFI